MDTNDAQIFVTGISCESAEINVVKMKEYLKLNSYSVVETPNEANTCILSVCVCTEGPVTAIFDAADKLKKINPNMRIIFAGCGPKVMPKRFKKFEFFPGYENIENLFKVKTTKFSEIAFIGNPSEQRKVALSELDNFNVEKINYEKIHSVFNKLDKTLADYVYVGFVSPKKGFDFSYRVLISEGCNFRCSYCIIWKATAPYKSFKKENILKQIETGYKQGHRQFLLTSNDSASYGIDIYKKFALKDLLNEIFEKFPDAKFGISYLSTIALEKLFSEVNLKKYADSLFYILVPIQTASKKLTKKMNRPYNLEIVKELLIKFKESFKGIMDTQLMYGFPDETENDIKKTINYIKTAGFDNFKASEFSPRPGTPLENEIPCENSKEHGKLLEIERKTLQTRFLRRLFLDLSNTKPELTKQLSKYDSKHLPKKLETELASLDWSEWKNENEQVFVNETSSDFFASFNETTNELKFFLDSGFFSIKLKENEILSLIWMLKDVFGKKQFISKRKRTAIVGEKIYTLIKENTGNFLEIIQ